MQLLNGLISPTPAALLAGQLNDALTAFATVFGVFFWIVVIGFGTASVIETIVRAWRERK